MRRGGVDGHALKLADRDSLGLTAIAIFHTTRFGGIYGRKAGRKPS